MKTLSVLLLAAGLILMACGEDEADPYTSDDAADTEEIAEDITEAPLDAADAEEAIEAPIAEETTGEDNVLALTPLPEPWPVDFYILPYYEIKTNETAEDGSQVLVARIPEETERPSFWDLGYYFRDDIPGWEVAEDDNWDCMLSDFDFNIPLTQGEKHILCEGYWDDTNQPCVILTLTDSQPE